MALGVENAGFDTIGLIEFDKDAADTLKKNRPEWNVIHDDNANISKLDLEDYFGIRLGELDLLSGGAPARHFRMRESVWGLKMREERYSIIMRCFLKNCSLKCFFLKTLEDC